MVGFLDKLSGEHFSDLEEFLAHIPISSVFKDSMTSSMSEWVNSSPEKKKHTQ